ncbi:MAG: hypothetical protein ABSA52_16280 [Candidatus Binatia bacterium]|jgi:hypothetical protein
MGQVRWAGWTMAIATALVISGAQARADVASDRPAAIVVYPKIVVDTVNGVDTVIRLANTNLNNLIDLHCFYIDANSHCTSDGSICKDATTCGSGQCLPSCVETDFDIALTQGQPIEWKASDGLAGSDLPLPYGVCQGNPFIHCGTGNDCAQANAGATCLPSNSGTRIPPVSEDPFQGELKCIETNADYVPVASNDLKGEAILDTSTATGLDVASYNAIGIQATAAAGTVITDNPLVLGPGSAGDYNGCPNVLILDNFFDQAKDPISGDQITTDLTLVACSEDLSRQVEGSATVQYLVYNEFEERYSTSKAVNCFQEIQLCNIDTPQCSRSIFSVGAMGTLTGQTRINPVASPAAALPSGLLGVAIESHTPVSGSPLSAAFNLHFVGSRGTADTITLP